MSYSYYQHTSPTWGTPQYQFGPPPTPNFQSQPSWGGMDFYRAHAATQDPSLFDHAWNRVRDYTGFGHSPTSAGVGTNEARHWHLRAYAGLGEISNMLPSDIGHAAAYEAYRTWIHNSSMYEPLSGDPHRQREGLIGLAVGEAARLLPYAGRQLDGHARLAASEAAAATASNIFYEGREEAEGFRRSRSRTRFGSAGSAYGDPYAHDDELTSARLNHHQRGRSHSRARSRSHSRPPMLQIRDGYAGSMPPGIATSYSGQSHSYGSYPSNNMPINMPSHGTPYPHGQALSLGHGSYPNQSYQPQTAPLYSSQSYQSQPYQAQVYQVQPYQAQPMSINIPQTASHHGRSMSYSQDPYAGMGNAAVQQQLPPIIIKTASAPRKHKHRHGHSHRHRSSSRRSRSRSISPEYQNHYPAHYRGL